jgi:hypothetical protein
MRIFLIDKFLIRHLGFLYLEIKSALFVKYSVKGNFKFFKKLYVRYFVNYLESFKYYIFYKTKTNDQDLYLDQNYKLNTHGIEFLTKQNINLFNFLNYNKEVGPKKATTENKIDYIKAELYARNSGFHKLVQNYLNVSSCNFYIASHNTFPYEKDEQVKTSFWHRDRDGIKLVKIFIYLTDVGPECGGHFFILGSHKKKPLKFAPQFRYRDKVVKKSFKNENIIEILGDAGTCFMEDTTGLHRGSKPVNGNTRSILSFTYFTGPLYYDENCGTIDLV